MGLQWALSEASPCSLEDLPAKAATMVVQPSERGERAEGDLLVSCWIVSFIPSPPNLKQKPQTQRTL